MKKTVFITLVMLVLAASALGQVSVDEDSVYVNVIGYLKDFGLCTDSVDAHTPWSSCAPPAQILPVTNLKYESYCHIKIFNGDLSCMVLDGLVFEHQIAMGRLRMAFPVDKLLEDSMFVFNEPLSDFSSVDLFNPGTLSLERGSCYYVQVTAYARTCPPSTGTFGEYDISERVHITIPTSCCLGLKGNVNGDANDQVDISDLMYMIDYMFANPPGPAPPCTEEADVNNDGQLDVSDCLWLIDYFYPPDPNNPPVLPLCDECP